MKEQMIVFRGVDALEQLNALLDKNAGKVSIKSFQIEDNSVPQMNYYTLYVVIAYDKEYKLK